MGAGYVATQVMIGGVGGAMGIGFIAAGAAAGAVVGGAACTLLQISRFGETFWERYKNCVAAPLSLVGMNPHDNLRIKKFGVCSSDKITVQLESANGRFQHREFRFANGALTEVHLNEPGIAKDPSFNVTLIADSARVAFAQGLFRDAAYYQQLCANPAQRQRIESKSESGDVADDISPGEVFKKTVK